MYERILVPVDGSNASHAGFNEALALAAEHQSRLRLIHVVDDLISMPLYEGGVFAGELLEQLRKQGRRLLDDYAALCDKKGLEVQTFLLEQVGGQAGDIIIMHAGEWPADLIVMGTHGRRGLKRLVVGSDAEYVIRHANVPVLLVRSPEE